MIKTILISYCVLVYLAAIAERTSVFLKERKEFGTKRTIEGIIVYTDWIGFILCPILMPVWIYRRMRRNNDK